MQVLLDLAHHYLKLSVPLVIPQDLLRVSPKVQSAIASGRPVVALETTIVTHGMPYPDNIHTALQVEDIVQSHGVTPATIGVLHGEVHIG